MWQLVKIIDYEVEQKELYFVENDAALIGPTGCASTVTAATNTAPPTNSSPLLTVDVCAGKEISYASDFGSEEEECTEVAPTAQTRRSRRYEDSTWKSVLC